MKEIKILLRIKGEITLEDDESVSLDDIKREVNIAHKNGTKIIRGTLVLEQDINEIIAYYFFRKDKKGNVFKNHILETDFFTFNSKRKFLLALINLENYLKGEDKNNFDKCTKRIMSLRNAFAHGEIIHKDRNFLITYFQGGKQEEILNENFWNEVEKTFEETTRLIEKISNTIEAQ